MGNPQKSRQTEKTRTKWNGFGYSRSHRRNRTNNGNNRKFEGQNVQQKTMADIGKNLGTTAKGAQRLLKLNDLIPLLKSADRNTGELKTVLGGT